MVLAKVPSASSFVISPGFRVLLEIIPLLQDTLFFIEAKCERGLDTEAGN